MSFYNSSNKTNSTVKGLLLDPKSSKGSDSVSMTPGSRLRLRLYFFALKSSKAH